MNTYEVGQTVVRVSGDSHEAEAVGEVIKVWKNGVAIVCWEDSHGHNPAYNPNGLRRGCSTWNADHIRFLLADETADSIRKIIADRNADAQDKKERKALARQHEINQWWQEKGQLWWLGKQTLPQSFGEQQVYIVRYQDAFDQQGEDHLVFVTVKLDEGVGRVACSLTVSGLCCRTDGSFGPSAFSCGTVRGKCLSEALYILTH